MLLTAIKLKVAALAVVAGIDTGDLVNPSKEIDSVIKTLETAQTAYQKNPQDAKLGGDLNAAFNTAVQEAEKLAQKDDPNAAYALAHWGILAGGNNVNVNSIVALYRKAGKIPAAQIELAQVLLQAFKQDADKAKEAVQLIIDAEAAGNKLARRTKAQLHLSGAAAPTIPASIKDAVTLLEKGSADNDGDSSVGLYQIYSRGAEGYPQDHAKALEYLKLAAEKQGNATALGEYGARLLNGDPDTKDSPKLVKKDVAQAIKMFEDAAKGGLAAASRILGQLYENGFGENGADVKRDVKKAFENYQAAARGNDAAALLRLAQAFETGVLANPDAKPDEKTGGYKAEDVLIAQNPKGALDLYRLAAQNKAAEAFFAVGAFYESGTVVDRDPQKAFALYIQAANAGVAAAMNRLAGLYANGTGVTQDIIAAAGWYKRSADAPFNFAASKIAFGMMAEQGAGMERSPVVAERYYSEAAAQGAPLALVRLATLHLNGTEPGAKPNLALALAYAQLALDKTGGNSEEVKNFVNTLETAKDKDGKEIFTAEIKKQAVAELEKLKKTYAPAAPAAATPAAAAPATAPAKSEGKKKSGTK
ncbi:MAG: sel1 repeat family protein [Verrucomicrobiaceae bacterium]|nr:sel1 repeat family protein [Verrucomicrobiaceae bacterium]